MAPKQELKAFKLLLLEASLSKSHVDMKYVSRVCVGHASPTPVYM